MACVCDDKYCDTMTMENLPNNEVHAYVTSKDGERFNFHKVDLNHKIDHPQVSITLHRDRKRQKIVGFGGAFTDSAGQNIHKLHTQKMKERLIKDYYAGDGLEYTIGRIPIGGSDLSPRLYTYDDNNNDDTLSKFALQHEDFTYKVRQACYVNNH